MATPKAVSAITGTWSGSSKLNFSEDPAVENVTESESTLTVETDPLSAFALLKYTWEYEGQGHNGILLIVGSDSKDAVTGGWADSWHQSGSVMNLVGTGMKSDRVSLTGAYSVEGYPDYGWRIEVGLEGDTLELQMTNISPDGAEAWAVRGVYRRS